MQENLFMDSGLLRISRILPKSGLPDSAASVPQGPARSPAALNNQDLVVQLASPPRSSQGSPTAGLDQQTVATAVLLAVMNVEQGAERERIATAAAAAAHAAMAVVSTMKAPLPTDAFNVPAVAPAAASFEEQCLQNNHVLV